MDRPGHFSRNTLTRGRVDALAVEDDYVTYGFNFDGAQTWPGV